VGRVNAGGMDARELGEVTGGEDMEGVGKREREGTV